MISDLEKLEDLIRNYKSEQDSKKKYVVYLKLVEESLVLVKRIVSTMYTLPDNILKEDLIQVGALGVLKGIETYELDIKGSYKTYVSKVIRGQILHYLRDKVNMIKLPRETVENVNKVKQAIEKLNEEGNMQPSSEDISKITNISENKVFEILNYEQIKNLVSLDQQIYTTEGSETLLDRIQNEEDETFEESFANKKMIENAIKMLPDLDRKVIVMYYMNGDSQKMIAEKMNTSPTQISRILKRALNKLYLIIEDTMSENK